FYPRSSSCISPYCYVMVNIYIDPLSLHDALPISGQAARTKRGLELLGMAAIDVDNHTGFHLDACQTLTVDHPEKSLAEIYADSRSEEHTSELQSRENLVCRLLLEKKNSKDRSAYT